MDARSQLIAEKSRLFYHRAVMARFGPCFLQACVEFVVGMFTIFYAHVRDHKQGLMCTHKQRLQW
mgnify:CR=1 FL=1